MAEGLPTPKSREQIVSEMLTEYVGLTGINDVNVGSVITQFFDVVARSIARTSGDIFQILRDFSIDRATGEALNRIGSEERVFRNTAQVATGTVQVTDTSFDKIETKVYSGAAAPNIGTSVIRVADASNFPATGRLYIGRGTPNIEGPINYSAVNQVGAFYEITLDSPTTKFHNISESVIVGQGGTRNIAVNTVVLSPGAGATADVLYNVSSAALLLDGENINSNVQVVAQQPGSLGNASAGSIVQFATVPFPNASVINLVPFTTGSDEESDDDYRDRIKKERLSRGLGTALAVKNAVLGAQASDENARVTSNEIDTSNPQQTILYIDNGEGYEEKSEGVGFEFIVDSAIGGEQNFQLTTGGQQTSIAKAFLESSNTSPFAINSNSKLAVLVGGIISEHTFQQGAFQAEGAATAFEVVASINDNPDLTFEASTSESGSKIVLRAKSEDNDFIQISSPSSGTDAAPAFNFPSNEINTVLLYKNKELLNKDGRSAFVVTRDQFNWSNSITTGDNLIISVDGTAPVTYTFTDGDFLAEGRHATVSNQNTLISWANVINAKVTGVTAEVNGEQLKLTSNLGSDNRAAISIDPTCDLVLKGMFSEVLGLSAEGNEADYQFSRNTAQIRLNQPLSEGDSLNLGSEFTRAEIESSPILGGQTTLSDTSYIWLLIDDKEVLNIETGVTADTFLNITKPSSGIIRYESTNLTAFSNVQVGDYVIVWSNELTATNRFEARVNAVTPSTLDIKVTTAEWTAAVAEGPILYLEGLTVIRSQYAPQKLKIDAGVYTINEVANILNQQLENARVTVENDEIIVFRTNTESIDGAVFLADFNDPAKALNLIKNSKAIGINSQLAFYETGLKDRAFPAFVHGKITADNYADPINSYINTIESDEDLDSLGLDPAGFMCLSEPYGSVEDALSKECVEIQNYIGTTVNVENSLVNKRNRIDDRYHVLNPYDFGHEDIMVAVLDNDPTGKTFNIPLYRTAITNVTGTANPVNFRAYDQEGGSVEFTQFFGSDFSFDNYKVLMRAKNAIDPLTLTNEDAILYRSVEWGRSGEKFNIGYFYPTSPDQDIQHIVTLEQDVKIKIFLKSGPVRVTAINGTTEWDITAVPSIGYDLVTYSWNGIGTNPALASINIGDYVSILNTGDFDPANQGSYRIDSSTATSFTVRKEAGTFVEQSGVATLQTSTISFFEPSDTTAQEIVDYVTDSLSDYITAEILQDSGTSGAGIINRSTGEDSNFAYKYVKLLDGKNYILSSNISVAAPNAQFVFKEALELPVFSTNTTDAYSFNKGEELKLIPLTSLHLKDFLNILAVTGYSTLGEIKSINRNTNIQISTNLLGTAGGVQVAGGTANSAAAAVEGSATAIGDQDNQKMLLSILDASSTGFHSDQWVKVFASEIQRKITNINDLNSIAITNADPDVGSSKIELFNRGLGQRFFGRNRYHTRTRGRAFKIENHGELVCISWDENGTEPYFTKTVELNQTGTNDISVTFNATTSLADYVVDSGNLRFDEVYTGDIVNITGFSDAGNNGTFKVIGVSEDGKTLRVRNSSAVNTDGNVNEIQLLSFDAIPTIGNFSLNFDGQITSDIPYNAVAADIKSALEALSNITLVNVTGDFSLGFTVEFAGVNAATDVSNLTVETNSLDVAINEFERYNFSTVTGTVLNDTNQIEELDFTAVTANDLDATNQIEEFDFTGLAGTDFDITGGKSIQLGAGAAYLWYNVTDGGNSQSDPGGTGTGIQVDVIVGDNATALAQKSSSAITAALPITDILSTSDLVGVLTVNYSGGNIADGSDVDTGVTYNKVRNGQNSKSFQLGNNLAYLWFNVTDGIATQTDSGGVGTGIQVDILAADTNIDIAGKTATAIDTAAAGIVGLKSASNVDEVLTLNYEVGNISNSLDVDSGITPTEIQNGVFAKSIQLADGLAYVWYDVTDGDNLQSDPGGTGTGIKVDVLLADAPADIALKTANTIDAALPIAGINDATSSGNSTDVFYIVTPTTSGADVNTGVTVTFFQNDVNDILITEILKGSQSGLFTVETEVQEGDSVIIGSDFSILNQGIYRVVRRFKNSIYIDNDNAIEEEVVLADQFIDLGSDASTNYNIEREGGINKLKWAGAGAEPSLEEARPGDVVILGTDFAAENQGEFSIVDSGEKLQQITEFRQSRGVDITSGQYALLYSAEDITEYYIWYNVDGLGGDPSIAGKTGIEIEINSGDSAEEIATEKESVVNTNFDSDFTAVAEGDIVTITTTGYGETTASSNINIDGQFSVETKQEGRRNFVSFVNVLSSDESNITITDVLEVHKEAIKFKEYEGVVPGDKFFIASNFLGETNAGDYVITDVLSDKEITVTGTTLSLEETLLDSNFNRVYIEESTPYVGYKQIEFIATNPSNFNNKNIVFSTGAQFDKINELGGVSLTAIGKFQFPTEVTTGVDSYKFHTGLIGEANRIVYGEPRDNTTYPGVAAAGAEIFIKAPLVRRVQVSVDVRVKTGVPFSTIVEEVRNSIAALINSNPVGQPIAISNIISNVDAIIGVQAVAISSPQYDAQNDVIRINSGEKALVLDIVADITVSKID